MDVASTNCSATAPLPRFLLGERESLRLSRRSVAILLAFGMSLFLIGLGRQRVLTYHEAMFAQPAKEMLATGNWILPTIVGIPSTHKPPLTHWSIAVSMAVFQSQSEWVARLPIVVATLLVALIVAAMAARWFGERVGLLAGLMQLTTVYSMQWGRLAECDMLLCAAVTAAMALFALANVDGPLGRNNARWVPWAFYAAAGLAFLAKGLPGPVFIFSAAISYFLVNQDIRGMRSLLNPVGLLIFVFLSSFWSLTAYLTYPQLLADQVMHHFGRYQGEMGGQKNFFYYAFNLPMLLLPWTPFVVMAVIRGLRQGAYTTPFWRFVGCWLLPGLAILWTSQFKSKHYALPLLPGLTIAGALGLVTFMRDRYLRPRIHVAWIGAMVVAGLTIASVVVGITRPDGWEGIVVLIALCAMAVSLIFFFEHKRLPTAQVAAIFGTVWLISVGVQTIVMPHHDSYRVDQELAARANQLVPDDQTLVMVELPENQITYYLDRRLKRFDDRQDLLKQADKTQSHDLYILGPEHLADTLAKHGRVAVLDRCAEIHSYMTPRDRLTLVKWTRDSVPVAAGDTSATTR